MGRSPLASAAAAAALTLSTVAAAVVGENVCPYAKNFKAGSRLKLLLAKSIYEAAISITLMFGQVL